MKNISIRSQIVFVIIFMLFELLISGPLIKLFNLETNVYLIFFKIVELLFGILVNIWIFHQKIYLKMKVGFKTVFLL